VALFFNLFAVAEPYTSAKVTHGTPCASIHQSSDVCEDEATGCLRTHFPSRALRAEPSWKRQGRQKWPM